MQLLLDLRQLEKEYGLGDTFEYDWRLYDYQLFVTFWDEFLYPMGLSFTAVIAVILLITADFVATLVVALCVLMTDLFLGGLIYYWGLSANPVVMVQVVLGIGCSVDFSAHIAYAYLVEPVPPSLERKLDNAGIRKYKARQALSKMGSSVFHGGFSTFASLSVLASSKTYAFIVFYRMWFGIILFGMANGFLLLPVVLSYIGTTETVLEAHLHDTEPETEVTSDDKERKSPYLLPETECAEVALEERVAASDEKIKAAAEQLFDRFSEMRASSATKLTEGKRRGTL